MVKLSVLDLAYIGEGFTPADALANSLDLAQHCEAAGFERFWLAEHHNLAGIASAPTAALPSARIAKSLHGLNRSPMFTPPKTAVGSAFNR